MNSVANKYLCLLFKQMMQEKQFEVTILSDSCIIDFLSLDSRKEYRKNREKVTYEEVLSRLKYMADSSKPRNIKTRKEFKVVFGERSFEVYLTVGSNDKWFSIKLKEV